MLQDSRFNEELNKYLEYVKIQHTEASKAFYFLEFIRKVFPEVNRDRIPYLEEYLRTEQGDAESIVVIRGRADAVFGNLILEFKDELSENKLEIAKEELRRYCYTIWNNEGERKTKYFLIATDGIHFVVFIPTLRGEELRLENLKLEEADRIDISTAEPEHVYLWLDRYLLYSESITPTTESFIGDFGLDSPIYKRCTILIEKGWNETKENSEVKLLYDEWSKYLEIVYGSKINSESLFLRHTYLSTLAKLIASMHYLGGRIPGSDEEFIEIITGEYFLKWGIHLFEEDFFSWIIRVPEIGLELMRTIIEGLSRYDFSNLSEDVLKGLYQQLVDPEERHDLGEYYTPDWLAEYIVRDVLDGSKSVLDPACGSGTFLVKAIHLKREVLDDKPPSEVLEHILNNVVGMDIHPLAVIISKVNYVLSLGELLYNRPEQMPEIYIPVYLSNSIFPPEFRRVTSGADSYVFEVDGLAFTIPASLAKKYHEFDVVIDVVKEVAREGNVEVEVLKRRLEGIVTEENDLMLIFDVAQTMEQFIREGRDTIWGFILKNIYKPVFLEVRKFDCIVGNPPWLSYRYIANVRYQEKIKGLITKIYKLLPSEKWELITQMEMATLFFLRVSDLYLADGGTIEFVMPRSVFSADQHNSFRKGLYSLGESDNRLGIVKIMDLERVSPLFNVPSCVIKAEKGIDTEYPVEGERFIGKLTNRNASLDEAFDVLEIQKCEYRVTEIGSRSCITDKEIDISLTESFYSSRFCQGATVVPRLLWFVEIKKHERLGINPRTPYVETSSRAIKQAKDQYKDVRMRGNVESDFLYFVITGSELVPFAYLPLPMAVLPIQPTRDGYRVITRDEAESKGFKLAEWIKRAEEIWEERKSATTTESLLEWLNYRNKLTRQNPSNRFKVVYNTSGTYIVSSVVDMESIPKSVKVDGTSVKVSGLIVDHTCYCYETDDEGEAYYLSACLNAPIVDELIKDMQTRGLFGPRHICKKVLELPIPKYNSGNELHMRLAELGKICERRAWALREELVEKYRSVGKIRSEIKIELENELSEISETVLEIFKEGEVRSNLDRWSN